MDLWQFWPHPPPLHDLLPGFSTAALPRVFSELASLHLSLFCRLLVFPEASLLFILFRLVEMISSGPWLFSCLFVCLFK